MQKANLWWMIQEFFSFTAFTCTPTSPGMNIRMCTTHFCWDNLSHALGNRQQSRSCCSLHVILRVFQPGHNGRHQQRQHSRCVTLKEGYIHTLQCASVYSVECCAHKSIVSKSRPALPKLYYVHTYVHTHGLTPSNQPQVHAHTYILHT